MECNKDEAIRAKEIAVTKMQKNDFEGARKIALKAKSLYPELDNITQLLCVCDVHCSAQKGELGSETDLYGILQVEKLVDDSMVKKQYRRLALMLHPDKNRFPGAEGAFKLISDANAVLSDSSKKSMYDNKVRALMRSIHANPQLHSMNKNASTGSQAQVQKSVPHATCGPMPASFTHLEVFWTCCPFCDVKYQYHRQFVNRVLRCRTCKRDFVGYEITARSIPVRSQFFSSQSVSSQATDCKKKTVPEQGNSKHEFGKNDEKLSSVQKGSSSDHVETEGNVSGNFRRETDTCKVSRQEEEEKTCNADANPISRKSKVSSSKSRKSERATATEAGESCDDPSFSRVEAENVKGNGANHAHQSNCGHESLRRSSRKRHDVSYNDADEHSTMSPLKRVRSVSEKTGKKRSDIVGKDSVNNCIDRDKVLQENKEAVATKSGETMQDKNVCHGTIGNIDEDPTVKVGNGNKNSLVTDDAEKGLCECPDPEFNNFDMERDEAHFQINQFWACYDTLDGMPRYYAMVKKVRTSPFELHITWLEAIPLHKIYEKWVDKELPVGCGSFRFGITDKTSARMTFSHLIHCEKGKKKGSFVIYPREGEVWAIFKGWDVSWSINPDKHKEFKYEMVEVLSNFVPDTGIKVVYLEKISGFVSLFKRTSGDGTSSFVIQPKELYRFSHRVPCFRMSGSEREGVPAGALELDPASIPLNPDNLPSSGVTQLIV